MIYENCHMTWWWVTPTASTVKCVQCNIAMHMGCFGDDGLLLLRDYTTAPNIEVLKWDTKPSILSLKSYRT